MKAKVFDRPEVNETTATFSPNGQFTIDEPIDLKDNSRVRIIIFLPEDEEDPDDTPIEQIREGLYQGWQDVLAGRTKPAAQLWEGLDVD
jgi:hypothetical protein